MRIFHATALLLILPSICLAQPKTPESKPLGGSEGIFRAVALSPDEKLMALGGADGSVSLWEVSTRRALRTFSGHTKPVAAVAFGPKGEFVVSVSYDQTVRCWNTADGKEKFAPVKAEKDGDALVAVAVSSDGKWIAAGGWDGKIHVWNGEGKEETVISSEQKVVFCLAFSPDGKRLASGGRAATIKIWDIAEKNHTTLSAPGKSVMALAWSSDGTMLASSAVFDDRAAGNGGVLAGVNVWNVKDAKVVAMLKGHLGAVRGIGFCAGDKRLVTGSEDRTARVWDLAKQQALHLLPCGDGLIAGVAVTADGKRVITASEDKTQSVRIWQIGKE